MKLEVEIEKKTGRFHLQSRFHTEGERFALLGASGCGKTMTLRCIAGIERPDRGRIVLGDRVLFDSEKRIDIPARKRRVGYLFQNHALFPNMTVRKNILCTAKDRAYAEQLMERFDLDAVADQYPAELSGGQSQRTALARLLASLPEVLLLDEPFSQLDNYLRTRIEHEILDVLETFPGPVILVTHDRNEAYRLAGRIGVMEAGRVAEVQSRQDFFDHPETVAAARLTGCKNITRLKKEEDGRYFAVDWGISVSLPESAGQEASHAGYRAHYFTFAGTPEEQSAFAGKNKVVCELKRVIEDTFSIVVCFRKKGNPVDTPDSLMTWIVGKEEWTAVGDRVMSGEFVLTLDPERIMLLSENILDGSPMP